MHDEVGDREISVPGLFSQAMQEVPRSNSSPCTEFHCILQGFKPPVIISDTAGCQGQRIGIESRHVMGIGSCPSPGIDDDLVYPHPEERWEVVDQA